jgi:PadR family transcriptional regulator
MSRATDVLVGIPQELCHHLWDSQRVEGHMREKREVWEGTLALMVLQSLAVLGPQHGYGIAKRIEQISAEMLAINQGTLYPVLTRLEQEGSIVSEWGVSENNRRAKFYRVTAAGRRELERERRHWERTGHILAKFFGLKGAAS